MINGKESVIMKITFKTLDITFKVDLLQVQDEDKPKNSRFVISENRLSVHLGYLTSWKEGRLSIGGLLGKSQKQ